MHVLRPAAADPAGAIVLMHGRGTSEQDVAGLLDVLDPRTRLVGACPRAPLSLPPGYHWYPPVARMGFPEPAAFHSASDRLAGWLEALGEATGIGPERTVLAGFSQGAVMAWSLGAGGGRPRPAGILALSGFIPTVPGFELDPGVLEGLPVAIAHGSLDPVIPVDFGRDAHARTRQAGADVTYLETAVGHTLDPRIFRMLPAWLAETLP